MLDSVVEHEGEPDIVQISGGEPTIHPDFFKILDYATTLPIRHIMINTNGIKIAQSKQFTEKLKMYDITGHVTLKKGERSKLATIAAQTL